MNVFVTGASGFLGREIVRACLERGHRVRALVRPMSSLDGVSWAGDPRVTIDRLDLRAANGLQEALAGTDCVVHAAAAKSGDLHGQLSGTVVTTERLLDAMIDAGTKAIVHVSSFAVYDYLGIRVGRAVDEDAPITTDFSDRDAYAQTKWLQEALVRRAAAEQGWRWTVLRPGVIYGPGSTWTARVGFQPSAKVWVRHGGRTRVPVTYVANCADAIVAAIGSERAHGEIINLLDDEPPTTRRYVRELAARTEPRPVIVPVPWLAMRLVARAAACTRAWIFGGRVRLPGLLRPASVHARCKPLRYGNARARDLLDWTPRIGLREGLDRSLGVPRRRRAARTADPAPQAAPLP